MNYWHKWFIGYFIIMVVFLSFTGCDLLNFESDNENIEEDVNIFESSWIVTDKPSGLSHTKLFFRDSTSYGILDEDDYIFEYGSLSNITSYSFVYTIETQTENSSLVHAERYAEYEIIGDILVVTYYSSPKKETEYLTLTATRLPENIKGYINVADSVAEFSSIQGKNNWYYGYYIFPFDSDSFNEFQIYDDEKDTWQAGENYWTSLGANEVHPNGPVTSGGKDNTEHRPVKRWISSIAGTIILNGELRKNQENESTDGVKGEIFIYNTEIWSESIDGDDTTGITFSIEVELNEGDIVNFVLSPRDTDFADGSFFKYTIWKEE